MEVETRIDLDIDPDQISVEEPERRSCLTCANCADLCSGCHCIWRLVGAKCTSPTVFLPRAFGNIRASMGGAEIDCPAWEGRG